MVTGEGFPYLVRSYRLHELVHLVEPHHTPEFWRRVERVLRVLPDFEER